jgi:hypothetical protein
MVKQAIYRTAVDRAKQVVLAPKKDIKLRDASFKNKFGVTFMQTAGTGALKGKAFKLNTGKFGWILAKDEAGQLVLIPRKKS